MTKNLVKTLLGLLIVAVIAFSFVPMATAQEPVTPSPETITICSAEQTEAALLSIGATGIVKNQVQIPMLYGPYQDAPFMEVYAVQGDTFQVIAGPVCPETNPDQIYWYGWVTVSAHNTSYLAWLTESYAGVKLFDLATQLPPTPDEQNSNEPRILCEGSIESFLQVGNVAHVVVDNVGPINIRDAADPGGELITQYDQDKFVKIISGPYCPGTNGATYWEVQLAETTTTGFTTETWEGSYYLEPIREGDVIPNFPELPQN